MSTFWPTTTISVLRGTYQNDAGDTLDSDTAVYTGIPASLMERSRSDIDSTDQAMRVYTYTTCRVPAGTDVLQTDRIKDETSGRIYAIQSVSRLASPVHTPDIRLNLSYVN